LALLRVTFSLGFFDGRAVFDADFFKFDITASLDAESNCIEVDASEFDELSKA
jgi:hypothetical protein